MASIRKLFAKRAVIISTCLVLVFGAFGFVGYSYADDLSDPYEADIYWFLDDQRASQYEIYSTAELYGLAQLVNGTAVNPYTGDRIPAQSFKGVTFVQEENLVLCKPSNPQEWTPIGTASRPFSGTYDGNGHTLRGLTITSTYQYVGFFGYTSSTSCIKNLSLTSSSLYQSSITLTTDSEFIECVGSLVGYAGGTVENCSSKVPIDIYSMTQTTKQHTYVLSCVGGLAGKVIGNLSDSSYSGSGAGITIRVTADSFGEDLKVCHSIGGVVGRYGDPTNHGVITNCFNGADIWVATLGSGAEDNWGITTYARSYFVGGVCGYTNGSIYNSYNGVYDGLSGRVKGKVQTSAIDSINGENPENRGGDEVGGVVGSIRGESDDPHKYNDGDPDDETYIQNCYNLGEVVGACAVGGVAGQAGAYCYVTQSYNGMADDEDIGHVVSTRWNKPCTGGVLGQGRGGSVSYCANYALIENTQTGYYTAGIVGVLWTADDYPELQPEMYACFNSGHVYTANRTEGADYREAGICGNNEGYIHDCVMLYGTVPYHDNSPIGSNDWGLTANLNVLTMEEMQSSECAAMLNESNNGSWDVYWYINGGYPVLNVWEDADSVTELSADLIASVDIIEEAGYLGPTIEPSPTLRITLTSGRILWQNTDFYVVPQKGAVEVTRETETPYSATIVGIGRFSGTVENVCKYGIGKGDLSNATIAAKSGKYSNGKSVYPSDVRLIMGGGEVDKDSYSYRIYDYNTSSLTGKGMHYVVYDSEGYVIFSGSSEFVPISQATLTGDYVLYDRDKSKISDSDGNVYNPDSGAKVSGTYACSVYKNGTPAGYVIEAMANSAAIKFTGSTTGYYSVSAASLRDDVSIEEIKCGGKTWYWDSERSIMYALDEQGNVDPDGCWVTFTGKQMNPTFKLSYLGKELTDGDEYRTVYGDPNDGDYNQVLYGINTSATTEDTEDTDGIKNGFTIRSNDSTRFSSYVQTEFTIKPAKFEDCDISIPTTNYAFNGSYIIPDIKVTLNGVTLKENRDYKIKFTNNLYRGTAKYTITAMNNLSGGKQTTYTGTFTIGDGIDISQYSLDKIDNPTYNFGEEPFAKIAIRYKSGENAGELVPLEEGKDYTVSFSSCALGKSTVTIKGAGEYTGTLTQDITILRLDVNSDKYNQVRVEYQDMTYGTWAPDYDSTLPRYNISASCPVVSVKMYPIIDWGNEENNYTPTYSDEPMNSRTYSTYTGTIGAYYFDDSGKQVTHKTAQVGTLHTEVRFEIKESSGYMYGCSGTLKHDVQLTQPVDLSDENNVTWQIGDCEYTDKGSSQDPTKHVYNGQAHEPVYGINKGSGNKLVEGVDYTVEYKENVNVGVAEYTVTAVEGSKYTGTYSSTFPIIAYDLSTGASITRIKNQQYTGFDIEPKPAVYVGNTKLVEGKDYTLAYMNNKTLGTGRVYVTGMGNYGGRTSAIFSIVGDVWEITSDCIADIPDYQYTGSVITPVLKVVVDAVTLKKDTDYIVSVQSAKELGTATVTIEGIGKYTGVVQKQFNIVQSDVATATVKLSSSKFYYDGRSKKPTATIVKSGRTLISGTDYSLTYTNNTFIGTGKVTIKGKGNYKGSKTMTFTISLKGTTIKKVKGAKKKFTITWNKQMDQTNGYQIRYSLKKSMKKSKTKTKTVKSITATKLVVKKLKAKKKYYVQIRTYKQLGSKYYYSSWSKKKTVKTK